MGSVHPTRIWPLIVTALAVPVRAQTRPATQPLAAQQAKEYLDTLRHLGDRPLLPPAPVAAVVTLGRDGDRLRVATRQPPTAAPSRLAVTDLSGLCTLTVTRLAPGPNRPPATGPIDGVPDAMLFDWFAFDRPGITDVYTNVSVLPTNVQLSRVTEFPDGSDTQVQLTEQRSSPPPDDTPGVHLKVTRQSPAAGQSVDADVAAVSFADLCRLYPAAVATYLEPIFRDLHADATALPADPTLACQVLAADVPVPPATAHRVRHLLRQLDADDPHARDAAQDQLLALGPVAALALARSDLKTISPEQRARVDVVLHRYRPVRADVADRLRADPAFLFNCLKVNDPAVVNSALARLRRVTNRDLRFDPVLTGQRRLDAVWALRQQPMPTTQP